jgi:SAM-dependent methyltransferase
VKRINDPDLVAQEYATLERLQLRRLDRTGWLRDVGEPIDTMLRAVAEVHPRRMLDAGCGTGEIAALVAAPEVVGIDRSPAAVEAARARGLDARVADVKSLPFRDGEFDVVLANWMLYHLPDLDRGLAEIARVLRPQGRFVGCYNGAGHMSELWSVVDPGSDHSDDYQRPLERFFAHVERRDTDGEVAWLTREDLQRYLDAFAGPLSERRFLAPAGPYPFVARRRNCVWVADR